MNLIIQLVVGGVIGWLASIVMKTNAQMGVITCGALRQPRSNEASAARRVQTRGLLVVSSQ